MTRLESILFIEDDADMRALLLRKCAKCFHGKIEMFEAGTWEEGERMVREKNPGIVLLDLTLPDSSQETTVERIRERYGIWSPVIVITGDPNPNRIRNICLHYAGSEDFMEKCDVLNNPERLCEKAWNAHLRRSFRDERK